MGFRIKAIERLGPPRGRRQQPERMFLVPLWQAAQDDHFVESRDHAMSGIDSAVAVLVERSEGLRWRNVH